MIETDSWSRDCPGDCIMYEGPDDDEWPLIIVHAPVIGPSASAPAAYRAGVAKRTGDTVDQLTLERKPVPGAELSMALYEVRDETDDPGEGDFSAVGFFSRGDVTVAVELKALNKYDLETRSKIFSNTLASVTINPVAAAAGSQALGRELKATADSIAAGYARGESAEMFLNVDAGVRNEYRVGGLQLVAYRIERRLLFLPGGVFIDSHDDVKEFRTPDLAWLKEEKLLGTWKRSGESYVVTRADGSITTYRPDKKNGAQKSLTADGKRTHWQIARLTASDLVGGYASINTSTSGGGSSNMAMVASRSDSKLRLLPDGRFEMSRQGWAGVLGENVTVSTGSRNTIVTGRYEWDPQSWMITLTSDDGKVTRGPMVPGPGQFTAADRAQGGDWNVLGGTRWWREK